MNPIRRRLLGGAAAFSVVVQTGYASTERSGSTPTSKYEPSPNTQRLLSTFGLTYPIFQAPLGPGIGGGPALPIAVSNAGAMGGMSLWRLPPEEAAARVRAVRSATTKPFAVNYVLAFEPGSLKASLDAGAPTVHFSWGMPSADQVAAVRHAGARIGITVTSAESARAALDVGADYLVCQGTEAGGHVQASSRLLDALSKVLGEARQIPVVAAGGLATGADILSALSAGAAGAMLGTRFVATRECPAHEKYKQALLQADGSQTVLTGCFDGDWPHAPHRVLRNGTFVRWEAAGCPAPGKRPGERDVVATRPNGSEVLRYSSSLPLQGFTGAQLLDCALYAGKGVGAMRDIPLAGDLVQRLWRECEDAAALRMRRNA